MEPKLRRKNGWLLLLLAAALAASEPAQACQIGVRRIPGGNVRVVIGEKRGLGDPRNPPGQGFGDCVPAKITVSGQEKSVWRCTWSMGSALKAVAPVMQRKIANFVASLGKKVEQATGLDTSGVAEAIDSASCKVTVEGKLTSTNEWTAEATCGSTIYKCDLYESIPAP